jgi:hypothetical protein
MAAGKGAHIRRMGRDGSGKDGQVRREPASGTTTRLTGDSEARRHVGTNSVAWRQRHWLSGLDSNTLWTHEGPSVPLLAGSVIRGLAIDNNRYKFVTLHIFELHNLMTAPRQLPPAARLVRALFDRLIIVPSDGERCGSQVLPTRRADRYRHTIHTDRRTRLQLRGNRL